MVKSAAVSIAVLELSWSNRKEKKILMDEHQLFNLLGLEVYLTPISMKCLYLANFLVFAGKQIILVMKVGLYDN